MPTDIVAGTVVQVPALDELEQHDLVLLVRHYELLVLRLLNELDVKEKDSDE